ncbi:hypothetical protein KUCAC02_014048, partial [Chaenocephalus aceratus]
CPVSCQETVQSSVSSSDCVTATCCTVAETVAFYFRTWTVDEEIWLWDWQAPPLPPGPPPSPQRPWLGPVLSFGINRRAGRS